MKTKRYPGVKPFEASERDLFFGRGRDISDLCDLVRVEKLSVLFGKSGYGKSSLLNAGVLPRLAAAGLLPVEVRFGEYLAGKSLAPVETLRRKLADKAPEMPGMAFPENLPLSLWSAFKKRKPAAFLLVFDQFEEFFSYPPEQQAEFKNQLAELLDEAMPEAVREAVRDLPREQRRLLAAPLDVRAVFAIRSDRMSELDRLKDQLPAILHKRYELRALTHEQAREAIEMPALKDGDYASPRFEYRPDALQHILDKLSRSAAGLQQGVEAFQLQILCDNIESRVAAGRIPDRDGNGLPDVSAGDLPDFAEVFGEYYQRRLDLLPGDDARLLARRVIEDGLVRLDPATGEGRRLSMDADALFQQFESQGLSPALLRDLENAFLLRREPNTLGGYNYELSHDTLLAPVLAAKKRRIEEEAALERERAEAEERERLRQEAEERERQLLENRRKLARARRRSAGAVLLAAAALVASVFAFRQTRLAEAEKHNAEIALDSANAATARARQAQLMAQEARVLADTAKADALRQAERARKSAAETIAALQKLGKTNAQIVAFLADDAAEQIYQLDYPAAAEKLKAAAALGQPVETFRQSALEVAFFYNEAGKSREAAAFLDSTGFRGAPAAQPALRAWLEKTDRAFFARMFTRYFPDMATVQGGKFPLDGKEAELDNFKIARTEATFWQFALFDFATGRRHDKPSWGFAGDNPAVNVSWYDAVEYANWLSLNRGLKPCYAIDTTGGSYNVTPDWSADGYRLPTEAEWEYAARGGLKQDTFDYAGSDILDEVAWWSGNSDQIHGVQRTNAAGLKKPNGLGLYDMSGNVWEWCQDWYDEYPPAFEKNPRGPVSGRSRVVRGGAWYVSDGIWLRVSNRFNIDPDYRLDFFGFRFAQDSK